MMEVMVMGGDGSEARWVGVKPCALVANYKVGG
jgi:hypothetical protein